MKPRINITRRMPVFNCRITVVNNAIISLSFPHIIFGFLVLILVNGLPEQIYPVMSIIISCVIALSS